MARASSTISKDQQHRVSNNLGRGMEAGAHTTSILWRLLDILEVVVQVNGNMNEITKLLRRRNEFKLLFNVERKKAESQISTEMANESDG